MTARGGPGVLAQGAHPRTLLSPLGLHHLWRTLQVLCHMSPLLSTCCPTGVGWQSIQLPAEAYICPSEAFPLSSWLLSQGLEGPTASESELVISQMQVLPEILRFPFTE